MALDFIKFYYRLFWSHLVVHADYCLSIGKTPGGENLGLALHEAFSLLPFDFLSRMLKVSRFNSCVVSAKPFSYVAGASHQSSALSNSLKLVRSSSATSPPETAP